VAFTWPFLWKGGWDVKITTFFTLVMLLVSRVMTVIHPLILKRVIENITCEPGDPGLEGDVCPTTEDTYVWILFYAAMKLVAETVNYLREIPFAYVSANAEKYIAKTVHSHMQNQSLSFHLSRETGKVLRMVNKGSQSFASVMRYSMFTMMPTFLEVAFTIGIIGYLYAQKFFWLNFGTILLYLIATLVCTEWRAKFFKKMSAQDAKYVQKATDSLLNFETVKYFNAEDHERDRFYTSLLAYKESNIVVAMSLVTLNCVQALCISAGLTLTLVLAYHDILTGELKVPDFVTFNVYILQIYFPLQFIGTFWRFIRQNWTDVELVLEILAVNEAIADDPNAIESNITAGQIEFKNIKFTYDDQLKKEDQRTILDNVSFTVPAGKSYALVGMTGSGKSTILRLLYRFYELQEGEILIDGQDIKKMRVQDLRKQIAIVPQDCVLFNDTIAYNIAYGAVKDPDFKKLVDDPDRHDELVEAIIPASKRAQIHDFILKKNKQWQTIVGERGLKLSGGEKQRMAIARALLKQTKIMCFDEATSALDTETERMVQAAIDDISKDSTSLIIAHRLSTVRNCDCIIALKHGVIVEQGSHDELLQIPDGYYKDLWEKQAKSMAAEEKEMEEKARLLEEQQNVLEQRKGRRASMHKQRD